MNTTVPCQAIFVGDEIAGRADEAGDMNVVAAGVHHADIVAGLSFVWTFEAYARPVVSVTGSASRSERIMERSAPRRYEARPHAVLADLRSESAPAPKIPRRAGRGLFFLKRQLGMGVQLAVQFLQIGEVLAQPNFRLGGAGGQRPLG